jgi:hypothetical protein
MGGTSTSAITAGGSPPGGRNDVESWNGTNWTETTNINEARYFLGGTGSSNTDSLVFGGSPTPGAITPKTEKWNGSSWTEQSDLNTPRAAMGSSGNSSTTALAAGGENPGSSALTATEEWTIPGKVDKTISTD